VRFCSIHTYRVSKSSPVWHLKTARTAKVIIQRRNTPKYGASEKKTSVSILEQYGKEKTTGKMATGNRTEKRKEVYIYLNVVRPMPALVLIVCEVTECLAALEQR